MKRFAQLLALRYDMARTRHSYYRDLRLLHEHFQSDPAGLTEEHLRDYILHVKTSNPGSQRRSVKRRPQPGSFSWISWSTGNGRCSHKSGQKNTGNCLP